MTDGPFIGPDQIHQPSGLTRQELQVAEALVQAWNGFTQLENLHPDHVADFRRAIHDCQRILASRVTARTFPKYWRQ